MADAEKPVEPVVPAAPAAAAPTPAPVVETPVAAPAAAPVEPVVAAEPHPAEVPTLLETIDKAATDKAAADKLAADAATKAKEPDKPVDAAAAAEAAKVAEAAKAAEAPKPAEAAVIAEPVKWDFKLPDTLKADEPRMAQFTGILDSLLTPKEGETRAQTAQKLVDLHSDAMTTYADQVSKEQFRVFNETRKGWVKEVMADPELGGSGHQTAMAAVARMRNMLVAEKDAPAFESFLRVTGAGDHPQFIKLLHNAARYFDEPPLPPANPKPSPNNGAGPQKRGMGALYTPAK